MISSSPSPTTCRIVLTMGDPAGIGPELCLKIIDRHPFEFPAALTIVGSTNILETTRDQLGLSTDLDIVQEPVKSANAIGIMDCGSLDMGRYHRAQATAESGRASLNYIHEAVEQVQKGRADALVTGPINKKAIAAAGSRYPGHTEMLGDMTNTKRPVMLLLNDQLKVAFATKHVALRQVPDILDSEAIVHTALTLSRSLSSDFDIDTPVVGVCALNPHASDKGRFGDEEERIIQPAVQKARESITHIKGPYPSDTLFEKAIQGTYDGIVALYHDQGMIPIKLAGVGSVVNVTLGLPFVRTSPGHGTAYDIVGCGVADPSSTLSAIRTALMMCQGRQPGL